MSNGPQSTEEPISNGGSTQEARSNITSTPSSTQASSSSSSSSLNGSYWDKLVHLIHESHLRFAWFVSNVVVVVNGSLYLQPLFGGLAIHTFWYNVAFLGAFSTFAIVIFQNLKSYKNTATGGWKYTAFLQDDNVHYLFDAFIWLIFPKHLLAVVPFVVFSLFHVLTFTGKDLLPALNFAPGLANRMTSFTLKYHELSRRAAASSELLLLIVLIFQALFFFKWSWVSLIAYSFFIKVKSEGSVFTRNVLKNWEVRVDGLVSNQSVPPAVKSYWGSFKRSVKAADKYSFIKKVDETQKSN